jgi:hypothetical protein
LHAIFDIPSAKAAKNWNIGRINGIKKQVNMKILERLDIRPGGQVQFFPLLRQYIFGGIFSGWLLNYTCKIDLLSEYSCCPNAK